MGVGIHDGSTGPRKTGRKQALGIGEKPSPDPEEKKPIVPKMFSDPGGDFREF